jgi:NitT/TauT family transport system ATP-binding protein
LRLIAGFEKPTEGTVLLDSKQVREPGPDRAMVFQDLNQLFPWKTTFKNVVYPLKVNKLYSNSQDISENAKKYLRMVGLTENFDTAFPHQLSGGMKQRVAIARALALDPKVLLMDEPFGSIDAQTRTGLQVELLRIWDETKKTILFVTHNIEEAILLGTRILVLGTNPGRVLQIFNNPLPRPRIPTDPDFGRFWEKLYNLLKQ